jgi:hypothetical protein
MPNTDLTLFWNQQYQKVKKKKNSVTLIKTKFLENIKNNNTLACD